MTLPRHPWLGRFIPALDSLVAASELAPDTPDDARVWRVAAFTWAPGTTSHGRKGSRRLMPYRVHWDVLADSPEERTGQVVGPGVTLDVRAEPEPVTVAQLRSEARDARWCLFTELSRWAPGAVAAAHSVRSAEIARNMQRDDTPLLDGPALEAVEGELMLAPRGFFERMLTLVVRPSCFDRADPELWIRTMLRREADQAVGRAIGDVLPGPQIRRLLAMHRDEPLDLQRLIDLYNRGASRTNRIGPSRAARALLAGTASPTQQPEYRLKHLACAQSAEDTYLGAEV
ncbi:hypothetical protein [Actinomyces gaoshouyii]|uniref:hypothetical protein n=1 Tax=Actinomyces gaoshouyii TaxID=1960083 RepID=UPI0009BDCA9F|nr:hypothetical protein [Actinomyces gaoshouyii]ARD42456.1 hypothetical protein B6G06_09005 [Actinomyces gaoshouyii]